MTSAAPSTPGWDALLADGSTVHIRRITPADAPLVVDLHARFSDRTRYLRYFSPYPRIPARDLARVVNVDHLDREAFVVATGDRLVALGQYERLGPSSPDAEVAFAVADTHQGRGIAPLLLEHLASAARSAGISRFVAEVLPANRPMLRVLADAGYQVSREFADGVVHLTFPIEPTPLSELVARAREHPAEAASMALLLTPRSVVVYGVRRSGTGAGAALLRNILSGGYTGSVSVVHPSLDDSTMEGVPVYASAVSPLDLAVVAVPWDAVGAAVADAGAAGARAAVVVSGGFAEIRASGIPLQRDLVSLARSHGMRLVGPNALGIVNTAPSVSLNATLVPEQIPPGRVGVFCQSGFVGIALLSELASRGLGVSTFVSVGNRADVSGNDALQYWRDDPRTDLVLLYLETFGNPHKFARIARELSRDKPVVAVAAGAASGTASLAWSSGLAPEAEAVAALVAHSGVIRVDTVSELLDVGQILTTCPLPAGSRVGLVGNAAALVQLAAATCTQAGLSVTDARWTSPGASPRALQGVVTSALRSADVETVLVVVSPPLPGSSVDDALSGAVDEAMTAVADAVEAHSLALPDGVQLIAASGSGVPVPDKPVVVVVVGFPARVDVDLPRFRTVEEAVRAVARVARYASWRRSPVGTVPALPSVSVEEARSVVAAQGPVAPLVAAYGISVLPMLPASTVSAVVDAGSSLGYPVAVKVASPELRDRSDLGAVRLDVADERGLRQAYEDLAARFGPDVVVQPMVPPGVPCLIDVVDDPSFGPVVGFGVGGIATDLLGDRAWRVAPLTDVDAAALVRAPRAAALLMGYRGAPRVDLSALEDLLLRVGRLADENPGVKRLTLGPILARSDGLSVIQASVVYGDPNPRPDTGPRHLP